MQQYKGRGQVRTTESSGWIVFPVDEEGEIEDSGPPVEFGDEELLMVRQLRWWWKRSLEKGKQVEGKDEEKKKEGVVNGGGKEVNGHIVNGSSRSKTIPKNRARRGGKVVNLNR